MFRTILLFVLMCLVYLTCNQDKSIPSHYEVAQQKVPYVSPELVPYVNEFLIDMDTSGVDFSRIFLLDSIVLVSEATQICESDGAIGCCNNITVKVKTAPDYVAEVDRDTYLRLVVYHELGHCVLRLDHHSFHISIMNPEPQIPLDLHREYWNVLRFEYIEYWKFMKEQGLLINFGDTK